MKRLIILILFTTAFLAFGQKTVDFRLLSKSWTQGKIDYSGKVIQSEINRGGWNKLHINSDSTVTFEGSFNCGFGHKLEGMWTLNTVDSTVTFIYTKKVSYEKTPKTENILQTVNSKIEKLTTDELITAQIVDGKKVENAFYIRTEKTKTEL